MSLMAFGQCAENFRKTVVKDITVTSATTQLLCRTSTFRDIFVFMGGPIAGCLIERST